ncbi:MAG: hypothetical protein M3300_03940, partial [Actinomycetota bacterium]|nr:hypothetical protein [Actinomycetota bacterium]
MTNTVISGRQLFHLWLGRKYGKAIRQNCLPQSVKRTSSETTTAEAATVMTKAVPDQTRLALHSCFQSNNVGKAISKDDNLYRNNPTDASREAQVLGRN